MASYEVEAILDTKVSKDKTRWYKVKWKASWNDDIDDKTIAKFIQKQTLRASLRHRSNFTENDEEDRIIKSKALRNGKKTYLVQWRNTWEPSTNLQASCRHLLSLFWENHAKQEELDGSSDSISINKDVSKFLPVKKAKYKSDRLKHKEDKINSSIQSTEGKVLEKRTRSTRYSQCEDNNIISNSKTSKSVDGKRTLQENVSQIAQHDSKNGSDYVKQLELESKKENENSNLNSRTGISPLQYFDSRSSSISVCSGSFKQGNKDPSSQTNEETIVRNADDCVIQNTENLGKEECSSFECAESNVLTEQLYCAKTSIGLSTNTNNFQRSISKEQDNFDEDFEVDVTSVDPGLTMKFINCTTGFEENKLPKFVQYDLPTWPV